jgi:hypothetical protein
MFNKDYRFVGKHARYVKFLNAYTRNLDKDANVAGILAIAVDVYLIAPLIGAAYNLRSPIDTESDESLNILASQIVQRQAQFDSVYRLVMLSEKSINLSPDERIERAFKVDEDIEKTNANMDLFHQYVRGGIEWLYEHINEGATTQDDYLEKIKELVNLYAEDFNIKTSMETDIES